MKILKKKDKIREDFFKKLSEENIEIKQIEFKIGKEKQVYALLHCPIQRLMTEAEKIKLDMKIDKVKISEYDSE